MTADAAQIEGNVRRRVASFNGSEVEKKQSKIKSAVGPNNGRFSIKFSTKYGLHTLFDTIDAFLIV